MPRVTCTRRINWCSGHRVMGHENKCANLHGHEYQAEITACAESLDGVGRVVDFSVIKAKVGTWIDDNWDHGFLLHVDDIAGAAAMRAFNDMHKGPATKVYYLPTNPTAENLAQFLLDKANELLDSYQIVVTKVVVHETPNCYAEVTHV